MTTTDVLRRLLDERGVEYDTDDEDGCEFTEWVANGLEWEADSRGELVSLMPVMLITPEQAIAATLGTGTCHMELPDLRGPAFTDVYVCSECGGEVMVGTVMGESDVPKWCPWCGRKVVDA